MNIVNIGRDYYQAVLISLILPILLVVGSLTPVYADSTEIIGVIGSDENSSPDYETVFSNETVHEILITIDPDDWDTMQQNMEDLYGEFGSRESRDMSEVRNISPSEMNSEDFKPPEHGMGHMEESEENPIYVPATITSEGATLDHVGVRYKGQTSLSSTWSGGTNKTSLKLNFNEFKDEYPETEDQTFYGFDELNLQAQFADSTLMSSVLTSEIFNDAGVITPHAAFYRVYIDYGEGPVYYGLYTMMESVEDTVISTQFADDSGNLYKPDGNGASFAEGTLNISAFDKKTNEDEADFSDIEKLYEIINSDKREENPEEWKDELESVFDVQEFLLWLATNTVIQNWDTYGSNCRNFYLYTDPSTGLITWIPWDFDFSLKSGSFGGTGQNGNPDWMHTNSEDNTPNISGQIHLPFWNQQTNSTKDDPAPLGQTGIAGGMMNNNMGKTLSLNLTQAGDTWPLIRYLIDDPEYYQDYLGYLEYVVTGPFEPSMMEEKYNRYFAMIQPYVTGEEGEQPGYTNLKDVTEFENSVSELVEHTQSRYDAVMEFLTEEEGT